MNGLPLVKFPQDIVTTELKNLIQDVSSKANKSETVQIQKENESVPLIIDETMETEIEHTNKRARENGSPIQSKNKKEKVSSVTVTESVNHDSTDKESTSHLFETPAPVRETPVRERESRVRKNLIMKKQKYYEKPDIPRDQYEIAYSHQTAYNIRNRSLTRESIFTNKTLKYTHAN